MIDEIKIGIKRNIKGDAMRLKVKKRNCPICKEPLNYYTRPREKDYTVCLKCGVVLLFKANLDVRSLTIKELATLPKDVASDLHAIKKVLSYPADKKICH